MHNRQVFDNVTVAVTSELGSGFIVGSEKMMQQSGIYFEGQCSKWGTLHGSEEG